MSTGLAAFDSTLQTTNGWLTEIMNRMGWRDRHAAYHALRAVLHVLRDRLSVDEASALGAQLPMLVRGIYFEGWHAAGKPNKERTKEAFLAYVGEFYKQTPEIDVEQVVRAVLHVLTQHVSAGEIKSLERALPGELRTLLTPVDRSANQLNRKTALPTSRAGVQATSVPQNIRTEEKPAIASEDGHIFDQDAGWMDE